jgi:hypothetical protein
MKVWFHYNKPASLAAGANRLTVHFRGVCHIVEGVDCEVPIKSHNNRIQPRCVMKGNAKEVAIVNGIAHIK